MTRKTKIKEDKTIRRFCGSRYGKEPISELFEDYLAVSRSTENRVRTAAESRSSRSTGSGGGGSAAGLTAAQQRELEEWNRANPRMKMTAREFAAR